MEMWDYKKGETKPSEIRFSLQRPPQHRDPDMAPTINPARTNSQEHLTLNHKLRKPVVEKLRRERINSSIEQLKSLLAPEFLKQQPESKLEKADILEMTVCFLRQLQKQKQQQQHPALDTGAVELGYAKCVHVVTNFLSKDELETQSQKRQFNNFSKLQTSFEKNLKEAKFSSVNYTVQTSINKVKSPTTSTPLEAMVDIYSLRLWPEKVYQTGRQNMY